MSQKAKANKEKLSARLTCLLCNNLFTNATTISECLHTFCKECIVKKLIDEKLKHCPICKADLGCSPLDKLRTDHNLQDLRNKIFPSEEKNAKAPDNLPSDTLPTKSKKDSISSLKENARRAKAAGKKVVTRQESVANVKKDEKRGGIVILDEVSTVLSARRAKVAARKKFIPTEFTPTCQPDKVTGDEKKDDHHPQNSSKPNSSGQVVPNMIPEDSGESLNSLVEAARRNKSCNKSPMQKNAVIPVPVDSSDNDSQVGVKKHNHSGSKKESDCTKLKKLQGNQEKKAKFTGDLNVPAEPVMGSSSETNKRIGRPVWCSLVASEEKEVGARLPQIPSSYLRVKDDSLPVSYIEKYVVKKLGLPSDAKVQISLQGQPVLSSLQLHELVEMWLQTVPRHEIILTSVGSSAKDFVMVLSYGLKA